MKSELTKFEELRISSAEFDKLMRKALQAAPADAPKGLKTTPKVKSKGPAKAMRSS